MIKNERQYRITKAQAAKLDDALRSLSAQPAGDRKTHPRLVKAQLDAMQSQLESLQSELREYEDLKNGQAAPPDLGYIALVPQDLIRARIASGLSQKELAERLGMPEQQLQRYEALEYESVSFARILEIAEALQLAMPVPAGQTEGSR
ncbi:MAG TPA: helix-turn-helix transcriptional regulator, partial [Blastocatellia bacterium]|nr:helix-turn-helix transcriptional regulator [Blastocatellia bacterium]